MTAQMTAQLIAESARLAGARVAPGDQTRRLDKVSTTERADSAEFRRPNAPTRQSFGDQTRRLDGVAR
jgi:hypothetical protein